MIYPASPGYVSGSKTSLAAAKSMVPSAGTVRAWVYGEIKRGRGKGRTCEEVEYALDLRHQTASARIRELFLDGIIEVIGERETSSGRRARVYVAKAV